MNGYAWDEGLHWTLTQTSAPESEPLDLDAVRDDHLRSPNGALEDDYIASLIATARRMAERYTRRALITQSWELTLDAFPCRSVIEIPKAPLQSVDSIGYVDVDGNDQTLDGSPAVYLVSGSGQAFKARVAPAYGTVWPVTRNQHDAVTVAFTAGYGDGAEDVPDDIRHGMLLVVGELYKQRSESVHTMNQNPAVIRAMDLWSGYRV